MVGDSIKELLVGEERMLGEGGELDGRKKELIGFYIFIIYFRFGEFLVVSWGEYIKLGLWKVSGVNFVFGDFYFFFLGRVDTMFMVVSLFKMGDLEYYMVRVCDSEGFWFSLKKGWGSLLVGVFLD